ncbi:MAG: BCD family MFS transporter [Pseudomonadota bacterium]
MTDANRDKAKEAMRAAAMGWTRVSARLLPFADAASAELPLPRLLRLSLFQVSVGMVTALLTGVLNRVMIVELGLSAAVVALMAALPLVFAPARMLIGHHSDTHHTVLGWRRSPYIWFGGLMQFGGLAVMPFALAVLSGWNGSDPRIGAAGAAFAFLSIGAGVSMTQTAGLALATDLAPAENRPKVVSLLYVMLLVGMGIGAVVFGRLLADFSLLRLAQVVQGSAIVAIVLNTLAMWKMEPRRPSAAGEPDGPPFLQSLKRLAGEPRAGRLLIAIGLGAAGFNMQDILLEPYGGEVLGLSVGATSALTALFAGGTLAGFGLSARLLTKGMEATRLAGYGAVVGAFAFALVIFAAPLAAPALFFAGVPLIGLGGGLFAVCTLTEMMSLVKPKEAGLALGAWGAVQASAAGLAMTFGGLVRDGGVQLAALGASTDAYAGYGLVYHVEILFLFAALVAIGPLARRSAYAENQPQNPVTFVASPG